MTDKTHEDRITELENDVNGIKLFLLIGRLAVTMFLLVMVAIQWGYV